MMLSPIIYGVYGGVRWEEQQNELSLQSMQYAIFSWLQVIFE